MANALAKRQGWTLAPRLLLLEAVFADFFAPPSVAFLADFFGEEFFAFLGIVSASPRFSIIVFIVIVHVFLRIGRNRFWQNALFFPCRLRKSRICARLKRGHNPSILDVLSERLRDVLALICQGKSDTEMSKQLSLSESTVRNHVASQYRKIGVNHRSAAI